MSSFQNAEMALVRRHKIIVKSGLPFNTMLRELRDTVEAFHTPKSDRTTPRHLIISRKVRTKLQKHSISAHELCLAISKGVVRKERKRRTTTSTPSGGERLLAPHELERKTVVRDYYEVSATSRCALLDAPPARRPKPDLSVRYMLSDKNRKYTIVDAYRPRQ